MCLVTLVLSGLAVFEIAQWHITRHLAQLALHAAGRAGAVTNANPQAIRATAAAALAPRIAARAGLRSWRIEILSPTATMFSDFSDAQLSREERRATIRNDFLAEQHASHQARGWANGIGPASGKDIFHANTLRLRLTVLYAPVVPGIATLLRLLPQTGVPAADQAHRHGMLAIVIEADTAIHSHPALWGEPLVDRSDVIPVGNASRAYPLAPGRDQPDDTSGSARVQSPGQYLNITDDRAPDTRPDREGGTAMRSLAPVAPANRTDAVNDQDALCGTLLCCPPK